MFSNFLHPVHDVLFPVVELTQRTGSNFWGNALCTAFANQRSWLQVIQALEYFVSSAVQPLSLMLPSSVLISGRKINDCDASLLWSIAETMKFHWSQITKLVIEITSQYIHCVKFVVYKWVNSISSSDHPLTVPPDRCIDSKVLEIRSSSEW